LTKDSDCRASCPERSRQRGEYGHRNAVLDGFLMVEWVGIDGNMVVLLMDLHAVAS
jgi:hypothetical protein